jgi:hypothetical protein
MNIQDQIKSVPKIDLKLIQECQYGDKENIIYLRCRIEMNGQRCAIESPSNSKLTPKMLRQTLTTAAEEVSMQYAKANGTDEQLSLIESASRMYRWLTAKAFVFICRFRNLEE